VKASDVIAKFLLERTPLVFGVQGGAAVHLFDSCERLGPKPIYCHHEQAAGFAAVAFARLCGFGACIVTTGPAATNAITPLLGAWQDSIPCVFISGQQRASQTSYGKSVRQVGSQEAPILHVVRPICKRGYLVQRPEELREVLWASYLKATDHRPGPVWIDICVDVQWADLPAFTPS
jgi:acetolactate synthase-1/2/3 large subunit